MLQNPFLDDWTLEQLFIFLISNTSDDLITTKVWPCTLKQISRRLQLWSILNFKQYTELVHSLYWITFMFIFSFKYIFWLQIINFSGQLVECLSLHFTQSLYGLQFYTKLIFFLHSEVPKACYCLWTPHVECWPFS